MPGPLALDETQKSFPAYADLTQTQGWSKRDVRIRADTNEAAEAVEVSQGSRYTEGALLGTGGMGKVMLARDARIGREVAVKVLHADRELDPDDRARFLREAQVQGQLEHPAIVPVYDVERRPDGSTFFTMRRVIGRTLGAILDDLRKGVPAAKARYTQRELLNAFATVCLAVDYAHSRGVVHRDLKPANIMLGDFGEVYVLDWGLARLVDEAGAPTDEPHTRLSMPGSFLGTPLYMAPEQMADPAVGPTADVYSLGLILFELLTLERARDPNSVYTPVDARPSVRTPYRNVAPELESICVKAVEPDPSDRFSSARAMQEAVNRYLEGDREIAQRKQLASAHIKAAREALGRATETRADYDKERGLAVTELGRAVALDPGNDETLAMLGDLMSNLPSQIPAEVKAQIDRSDQHVMHMGAKFAVLSTLSWFLFFPLVWWVGFADTRQAPVIAVPAALTIVVNLVMARRKRIGRPPQYLTILLMLIAFASVSRFYGIFIIVPTMLTTFVIVLQTHPDRLMRSITLVAAPLAFVVPALLEWTGAVPSSYVFEHGTWTIVPQLVELPRGPTFAFLVIATLAMILTPAALVRKLRTELSDAQVKLAVQAWHFRRLGAQLIGDRASTQA